MGRERPCRKGLLPQKGTAPAFIGKEDWNENNRYYRKGIAWRENFNRRTRPHLRRRF